MEDNNIGYWYNDREAMTYPVPIANSATPEQVKKMVENFNEFTSRSQERFCKGSSICRLCNKINGSSEFRIIRNGKSINIPSGLLHYITEHHVLVKELLEKVI